MTRLMFPAKAAYRYTVATYDGGPDGKLTLSGVLRVNQEAGEHHMQACGLPYPTMRANNVAFVLVRLYTRIHALPGLGDDVVCETWSSGSRGAQFFRGYVGQTLDGTVLWETTGVLVAIDPARGKILRPDSITCLQALPYSALTTPPADKLRVVGHLPYVGTKTIRRSDLDVNNHWNNTKYADALDDFFPGETALPVNAFAIQFSSQAVLGGQVQIAAQLDGDTLSMQGTHVHDGSVCFIATARYGVTG